VRHILYLHGLASSPKGRKAELLKRRLAPQGCDILAPDLNAPSFERLDFRAIVEKAAQVAREARPAVIVGSSLGALVALSVVRTPDGAGIPLVLLAPALAFGPRWLEKLPEGETIDLYHHGEGKDLPIHRQFFEGMAYVTIDDDPPPVPVSLVMGTEDETVPFDRVEEAWRRWEASGKLAPGSRFHRVEGGDHSLLEHGDVIEAAVRERLGAAAPAAGAETPWAV
jgi:pimeloyl-ACP methyl ester carboxylesterase